MTYRSHNSYLKEKFGCKVYKISLSTGCSCPNRDGTKGIGGCTFCSLGGSGDFATKPDSIEIQFEKAKQKINQKFPKLTLEKDRKYIAYFQSYTNTYVDKNISIENLRTIFITAINKPEVVALSIGTRPDCISDEILKLLTELNKIKPVWIELGLQTIHEKTAQKINRQYSLKEFEECYYKLKSIGVEVIVHVILGFPNETKAQMLETIKYLAKLTPTLDGIKIQLLHILEGTKLAEEYKQNKFKLFSMEEYCELVCECLKLLPPQTVIHRMTGDGPKKILIAPLWSADKKRVLNTLKRFIEES